MTYIIEKCLPLFFYAIFSVFNIIANIEKCQGTRDHRSDVSLFTLLEIIR